MSNIFKTETSIEFTASIDRGAVASAIISAVECGIYYWARDVYAEIPATVEAALTPQEREWLEGWGSVAFAALHPGCAVLFVEHGGDDAEPPTDRRFTHEDVARALATIAQKYPWHIQVLAEGGDSNSGDVLFQLAALSDVVYG